MRHVLLIRSSLFGDQPKSAQIAGEFLAAWRGAHPGTGVTERALTDGDAPQIVVQAGRSPPYPSR